MPPVHEAGEREEVAIHRIQEAPLPDSQVDQRELGRRARVLPTEVGHEGRATLRQDSADRRVGRG